ncbi:hypothetical protein CBER1_09953 [Cercospora berteroae]|uniref:FAD-binding domain-containing protein n=1 Tax=Cercospora berteroae TaxID=357750 RepID=A0A2S6CDT6_9PEZI|nr:hypothetical protein CBER1_09953 [Cercospora berteroae]
MSHSTVENVPVLIVGAGPSGATTALLLARYGIKSLVISRHVGTANTPRAHIFNQRAMEVLRDAGLEEVLASVATPANYMMHTTWSHSLAGEEYGRMYAWGNRPDRKGEYEAASPCVMSDLPQSVLEPILVESATKAGAEFRFSTEFVGQVETDDGVETTVRERQSGLEYRIDSRYLIGADGARSAVLETLNIPVDGQSLNNAFNVHIKANLNKYLTHRPGTLNWILNPDAPQWSAVGNFRVVHPFDEFVVSMHPAAKDGQTFEPTEDDILQRLHQMIGDSDAKDQVSIKILSSFRWTINDQVARTWQKGSVICIGDAVHRHPPINGLGSNTCISDAMNISWKLAYVLHGRAHARILDSITIERKPVGDGVVRRANAGMEDHRRLWELIGLSAEAREQATELMAQPTSEGKGLRRRFLEALEQTDNELNALGIQMNQIYAESPLVTVENGDTSKPDLASINLLKQQVISTYPGHHLPHVWIAKDSQSERISTLDVCGRGAFTLLTGIGGDPWREWAADLAALREGLVLNVVSIGWRQDYKDLYGDWSRVREVEDEGAVLVRPDHFVAWRCQSASRASSTTLIEVFDAIFPLP